MKDFVSCAVQSDTLRAALFAFPDIPRIWNTVLWNTWVLVQKAAPSRRITIPVSEPITNYSIHERREHIIIRIAPGRYNIICTLLETSVPAEAQRPIFRWFPVPDTLKIKLRCTAYTRIISSLNLTRQVITHPNFDLKGYLLDYKRERNMHKLDSSNLGKERRRGKHTAMHQSLSTHTFPFDLLFDFCYCEELPTKLHYP